MRALLRLLALQLAFAGAVDAGPWPRMQGETYVFAGQEAGSDGWSSLYLETGLPRDVTFGLDAGGRIGGYMAGDPDRPLEGRVRTFLRLPVLSDPERRSARTATLAPWLAAVELGLGIDVERDGDEIVRPSAGLTVGRPLETPLGPGWTTLDLRATFGGGSPTRTVLGAVLGAKPSPRVALELGLFAERSRFDSVTLAPTVQVGVGRVGDARLGLSWKDDGELRVRVGLAQTF